MLLRKDPNTSSGRVGGKMGAARSSTPVPVSSTTNFVPGGQRKWSRTAFGRMTWPLVETMVVRESGMGESFGKKKVRYNMPAAGATALYTQRQDRALIGLQLSVESVLARFEGTSSFVATEDLKVAVNAAVALQRPLLIKGEPGTGKTVLAHEVANALNKPLISWHVKSTTKAQQGLYEYDAVSRLRDSQLGDARVHDIGNYIIRGKLWDAFDAPEAPVLLIDEIDKADIEFPNDLLLELDKMEFFVYETRQTIKAQNRPVIIITSNNEKELPDAFLRRCFFHYIKFPDRETMEAIVEVHFPGIKSLLLREALTSFYELREIPGLKKRPSTSEFLDWLKLLLAEDIGPELLKERSTAKLIPPLHGALLKNEQDVHLFERLAFLHRRGT
jgi:MoxR-like ATPase